MRYVLLISIFLSGCGIDQVEADSISIQAMNGPGGVTCYVIMQGGQAKGGNCL